VNQITWFEARRSWSSTRCLERDVDPFAVVIVVGDSGAGIAARATIARASAGRRNSDIASPPQAAGERRHSTPAAKPPPDHCYAGT
jgi:hypothetical protein